ncbi:MAG: hypothetical protein QOI47_1937 [Actinomycetota bacterium]|nr:hypothetical protein [Actinomycetota bacterium]
MVAAAALVVLAACSSGTKGAAPARTTTTTSSSTTSMLATTTTAVDPTTKPIAAGDAPSLARQIIAAETAIADDTTGEAALAAAAHLQQVAYRALAAHPEWDSVVGAALPASMQAAMHANVSAGRQLRSLVKSPKPNLPPWTIVAPAPRDELLRYYREGEATYGVPWEYLAAVNLVETKMGRIRGTSTAGAQGPMQFLPSTWMAYGAGGDINSNHDAILTAARYLHANGAPARMADALHHYNPADQYVTAVTAYAERMADEHAYRSYYHWQVYYWSTLGDVWLRVGYHEDHERPVTPADL